MMMLHLCQLLLCRAVAPTTKRPTSLSSKLYGEVVAPGVPTAQLASLASALAPLLGAPSGLSVPQKFHVLATLSQRGVRHEGVLQKCIWDILKADLKNPQQDALYNKQLAACTSSTFHLMTSMGFMNDNQMTALALGRCIELTPLMPLSAVVKVYQGLAAMNQTFFSLSSVALYDSNVAEDFTLTDRPVTEQGHEGGPSPTAAELANQPNLIDLVCGELENRMVQLAASASGARVARDVGFERAAEAALALLHSKEQQEGQDDAAHLLLQLAPLVHSVSRVGATSPDLFTSLGSLFHLTHCSSSGKHMAPEERVSTMSSLVGAIRDVCLINERVVDPMNHVDSADFVAARTSLATGLASQLSHTPGLAGALRHHPPLVLSARRLFETFPELADGCPALWDQVRSVRVAHRHVVAAKTAGRAASPRLGGKLFDRQFAVKVKPISQDLSSAERFVPPQFKTWRSPAHKPRGGHQPGSRGPGRVVKFGTRRISKDYIKNKRKRFSQG